LQSPALLPALLTALLAAFLLAYWLVFCSPSDVWFSLLKVLGLLALLAQNYKY
jgi:hypothetical protein